jgi:hypothetical protein
MTFEIKRSPARICWWVLCNGVLLSTADTKGEALFQADFYRRKYAA